MADVAPLIERCCQTDIRIVKMTNKEDGDTNPNCKPRMAALLAVHLVSQVLDEAFVIASAANDSGQPWQYLSMLKSFKASKFDMEHVEASFEASKGDCELNENKMGIVANVVATSTPQKLTRLACSDETALSSLHNDATFIGQGDEDLEKHKSESVNSTSMLINHLFDMSDMDRIVNRDESEIIQSTSEPHDILSGAMNNIMNYADIDSPKEHFPLEPNVKIIDGAVQSQLSRSDNSDYSFLADAFVADITRDVAFYIEEDCENRRNVESYEMAVVEEIKEDTYTIHHAEEISESLIKENDVALFESAYATLNRDYDQGSEGDGFPILQDPKGLNLQEVKLMTANTSDDDLSYPEFQEKEVQKREEVVPSASGISASQKSSLARRCRLQGSRLLACLRGWWRRKTPGKRKDSRGPITLGICPLSPDARRRASSLLDNRLLRSPSPSRNIVWKFNTVNEAMIVNSNCWKDYTFDIRPDDY